MLTRLKASGFKNLVDVDVRFGPFTCIAGPNGAGKSNLFDAIRFLSALADRPLTDAALSVRDESGGSTADIRSLFHRIGNSYAAHMAFEAEMIVPHEAHDDFGQRAEASITFLRYTLILAYRENDSPLSVGPLEIVKEELVHINRKEASRHILFPHRLTPWRKSAVRGQRRGGPFISTEERGDGRAIRLHQDRGGGGRPFARSATDLPRTVLSAANAAENPTALLARREMQSWYLLQLEPSALRQPDELTAPTHLGANGAHLPATLYRLAKTPTPQTNGQTADGPAAQVYSQIANRLAGLIDDVHDLWIEHDERRELLTLYIKDRQGTALPARVLSDGTLRFLALAVFDRAPEGQQLLCLEEPENGIHPGRIPAMLNLLRDIATDVEEPIGFDNPLRQVIVNTHSPAVVSQVDDASLLVAELKEDRRDGRDFKRVCFSCLPDTWRTKDQGRTSIVPKGKVLVYLNPTVLENGQLPNPKRRRVIDRPDMQPYLPLPGIKT